MPQAAQKSILLKCPPRTTQTPSLTDLNRPYCKVVYYPADCSCGKGKCAQFGVTALRSGEPISKNRSAPSHSMAARCFCKTSRLLHCSGESQNFSDNAPLEKCFNTASPPGKWPRSNHPAYWSLKRFIQ